MKFNLILLDWAASYVQMATKTKKYDNQPFQKISLNFLFSGYTR